MKKIAWLIIIYLCMYIGIFRPLKYFLADGPIDLLTSKPDKVLNSVIYMTAFYIHITFGGIALLIGWIQFIKKFRDKFRKAHRIIGKIYVLSVLISAPVGFYIGLFASGGIVPQIGFTFGAFIWFVFTYLAYKAIRNGNIAKHREYMIYSYVGSFAAVMLRFILYPLIEITGDFAFAYSISVWGSWLPNFGFAYLWVHKRELLISIYKKYKLKQVLIGLFILSGSVFLVSHTSPQTWLYKSASFEGEAFPKNTSLTNSIFTKEKIQEISNYLKEEAETTSMLVLENGKVVFEYGDVSEISNVSTVRKGIVSLLYGKYVENGLIELNQTLETLGIDEEDGLLSSEKEATIQDVLTARSGIFHEAVHDERAIFEKQERGTKPPGTYFLPNQWDYNVAAHILEEKTGRTIFTEFQEQLAVPLGFQDWNYHNQDKTIQKSKSRYAAYNFHLSTRDMAKIGQLMLQEGNWNGKQLISKDWIQKITTTFTPKDTVNARFDRDVSSPLQQSYGHFWWIFDRFYDNPDFEGAYTAQGEFGQYITVIPKRNMVVAHKTTVDIYTLLHFSDRTATPTWRYWWILRKLLLHRKPIASLETEKSTAEIIEFIRENYTKDSDYGISERLINEYGLSLAEKGRHEEAILMYQLNLEIYPKGYYTHRIYDYYAESLRKLGREAEALPLLEKSLEYNPWNTALEKELKLLKKSS
ncbi:CubicO group peptidase (beta-lactamase class C family) [Kordia periserrulae]|uniref:CubicO group peptidase (Beta-lactamase class C family) n=1 Tax=Kordia periserrulae TaxID=701523 RepID=A0A2T6BZG9_9FLAO|nr:DUF2306 domain-containing protein [Kordia periserrulae]PTX61446.1 CubicO group peptidase (beta-lactamase class C family) [Kordia periserrulae]